MKLELKGYHDTVHLHVAHHIQTKLGLVSQLEQVEGRFNRRHLETMKLNSQLHI